MDERTIAAIGQGVAPAPSAVGGLIADLGSRQVVDESGGYRGNVRWPTDDDLATAIRYDRSYGDRSAGFFNPGGATALTLSMESAPRAINKGALEQTGTRAPVTPQMADQFYRQWMAASKSPTAALGFDPRHMTSSSSQDERLNVAGVYLPKADMAWFDRNYESAGVHEMMHRGLQKLAEAGLISKQQAASESLVRGLMLKHFGDVELSGTGGPGDKQIEWARQNVSPRELDQLENVAAKYRAQLQPRGPR